MMLNSINNLRLVAEHCGKGQKLPDVLAAWLAHSLDTYLEQRSRSLNEAFGLINGRGGVPWRMEEGIRRRDAGLRALCERHFGDLSLSAQPSEIHKMSARYAASTWRFDREREQMPDNYRGTGKEFLWEAFKSGATMPLCTRQLRTVLAKRRTSPPKPPTKHAASVVEATGAYGNGSN